MTSEELVNRLRERAKTLWQWAGRAERTTGPSATTREWRTDGDLHDDAATELARLTRELEATRAALRIAQTTAANLHDTIRLRDRELEAEREKARRLREALERVAENGCERFHGVDCWQMGMDPDAEEYAARVCDPCYARRALVADTEVSDGE